MKKTCLIVMAVMALASTGLMAEEAPGHDGLEAPKNEKELAIQNLTIVGKVVKVEKMKKDGTPMMTWFNLIDEEGKEVRLPKGKVEDFVNAKVKITGTGYTLEKKGKAVRAFKTITTIDKLADPTPAK
ncbi:MAG: hypothetical protein WCO42_06765 [bacterium]